MSIPFEVLMEYAASLTEEDLKEPMGQLAARAGTMPERLADAMAAVKVARATPLSIRASMHPAVRRALEADRGGVDSGSLASFFGRGEDLSDMT